MTQQTALTNFIHFCENLSPDKTAGFAELYTADAFFKDTFNEVSGHAGIISIFKHMFSQVETPRFRVTHNMLQDDEAFLVWDFLFSFKGNKSKVECIHGASHLKLTAEGKIFFIATTGMPPKNSMKKFPCWVASCVL